jgi:hypothetical protein
MLAIVGWIAADIGLRAPGLPADSPLMSVTSFTAHDAAVKQGSMIVLLIFCGVCEIAGFAAIQQTLEGKRAPGDFALTGNIQVTDSIKKAEIKHSRLAMMAFSGIVTQATLTGGGFPYTYNGVSDLVPPLGMASMPGCEVKRSSPGRVAERAGLASLVLVPQAEAPPYGLRRRLQDVRPRRQP